MERLPWLNNGFICKDLYAPFVLEKDIDLLPYTYEEAGGFVGCTIGMYTSSNGAESGNHCDFAWLNAERNI